VKRVSKIDNLKRKRSWNGHVCVRPLRLPICVRAYYLIVREDIASRRKKLKQRRDILATAESMHGEDQANFRQTAVEVAEQKFVLLRTNVSKH
jgi:hypothetical protein